jgi:hypothetical protein
MRYLISVLGDCGIVHPTVDAWRACRVCKAELAREAKQASGSNGKVASKMDDDFLRTVAPYLKG